MLDITEKISSLKKEGLYRDCRFIESAQAPKVIMEGKEMILLGSNHYLGLNEDERLKQAAIEAIHQYGVGAGGSRLTTGSFALFKELEEKIAAFKGVEASLVFNTGYMTNVGVLDALCGRGWTIFCDKYNHASIIDGALRSGAQLVRYKHCDMEDLERKILKYKSNNNLIVTDGVFSMDGDIAPLDKIVELAKKYDLLTMVDDAHGVGILGEKGAGTVSYFGLASEIDIQIGTLSKAIPSLGGYVAGKKEMIDYFRNFSRSFIFSTALPPASVAVSLKAIEIIETEDASRKNLLALSHWFKEELKTSGFHVGDTLTPILPVIIGDAKKTVLLRDRLLEEGIYIPAIRPPTVPKNTSRLRISLMATHSKTDLEYVLQKLIFHSKQLEIIK